MSMNIKVQFSVESNRLPEVKALLKSGIERGLEKCGGIGEGHAKTIVHVVTGNLRNSIDHKVIPDDYEVQIGSNVEYAAAEELGTSRRPPHPYLRPALENHISEFEQAIRSSFTELR